MCFLSIGAQAQKINIQSASDAIRDNDLAKAKDYIDKAVNNTSTSQDTKAWLLRGAIYQAIATDPKATPKLQALINGKVYEIDVQAASSLRATTPDALNESFKSYENVVKFSKKVDNEELFPLATALLFQNYNEGIAMYKANNNPEAFKYFTAVEQVGNLNGGKVFEGLPVQFKVAEDQIKEIRMQAKVYKGYAAYAMDDDATALSIFESLMKSGGELVDDNIYAITAQIYNKQKNTTKYLETLNAGIAKFPKSERLINEKLNYHITSGDANKAIQELEAAIAKDPSKPELHFNAGIMYAGLADKATDPVEQKKYFDKAEQAYNKAVELDKANPDYIFNLGGMFYMKAKGISDRMGKENDDKKYEAMKTERDAIMAKAVPLLEQAKSTMEASDKFKKKDEATLITYKDVLKALNSAYVLLNKLDKAAELQPLLKDLD